MKLLEALRMALMRSSRTFIWSATGLGLILQFSFFAAIGYDLLINTLQINEQAATNIATLTEEDVARNIELYDLSLQAVLDGINDPDVMSQKPALRQKALFDRSATAHGLGALVALDQKGQIFLDSQDAGLRKGYFGDREYFAAHRDATRDIGLYISRPFRARLQDDIWSISVSRRISGPNGGFAGIVSGTMKLDYFRQLFSRVALGTRGSIVLLRDDGTLIMNNAASDEALGADWSAAPVFAHLPGHSAGSFMSDRSIDGVERLYAFRRIGDLPLVVVVGLSLSQVLAPWWSKVLVLMAIFVIMASSVLVLVWLLETELRRRASAEAVAAELARTDGLTTLANRRAFEEALSDEWARAAREGRPLSLVMIDADHFKLFNDTYGHQAGDLALTDIANVIKKATRRPGELAARYGGEEFAVLLPNTDRRSATQVAEAILYGVRSLKIDIDNGASQHQMFSVSIGVASATPHPAANSASLVRDADAALYRAKESRNIVCVSGVMSTDFEPEVSRAARSRMAR
jgi:diguanylate cyclase (GGDEF)-like protein